jgi:hypothetical protein
MVSGSLIPGSDPVNKNDEVDDFATVFQRNRPALDALVRAGLAKRHCLAPAAHVFRGGWNNSANKALSVYDRSP